MEKKKDPNKKVEEKTINQDGEPEEKKSDVQPGDTGIKNEEQKNEVVLEKDDKAYTAKDIETLENKARDFDGIIEKRRLEKLSVEEEKPKEENIDPNKEKFSKDEVQKMILNEVAKVSQTLNTESYNQGLSAAYKEFVKEHPWADSDEAVAKIKENFSSAGQISKDGLLNQLKIAAQNAYPQVYNEAIEAKIKAKVLTEERDINGGDGGGGNSVKTGEQFSVSEKASKEDKEMADKFMGGDLNKWMKYKSKE